MEDVTELLDRLIRGIAVDEPMPLILKRAYDEIVRLRRRVTQLERTPFRP